VYYWLGGDEMNTEQLRRKARELYNNKEVPQEVNKTLSKTCRMANTAATAQSLKHLAHAVEKITSYLLKICTMMTKKQ